MKIEIVCKGISRLRMSHIELDAARATSAKPVLEADTTPDQTPNTTQTAWAAAEARLYPDPAGKVRYGFPSHHLIEACLASDHEPIGTCISMAAEFVALTALVRNQTNPSGELVPWRPVSARLTPVKRGQPITYCHMPQFDDWGFIAVLDVEQAAGITVDGVIAHVQRQGLRKGICADRADRGCGRFEVVSHRLL